jgi:hypothetical protein
MTSFGPTSRYYGVATGEYVDAAGRTIAFLKRRPLPAPESLATLGQRPVLAEDRVDTLAARLIGDPAQFWRLCDANGTIRPTDLVAEPGALVRIALPEGVPGGPDA